MGGQTISFSFYNIATLFYMYKYWLVHIIRNSGIKNIIQLAAVKT